MELSRGFSFFMFTTVSGKLPVDMIARFRYFCIVPALILAAMLSGCQSAFGPQALERTHPAYNEAIISSINEQMLQNLVRMRYRDVPFFLEIGSVTASLSLGANAGVDAGVNFGSGDSLSPGAGIAYSDKPTISYTPLRGEDLLKSILSPLHLEDILVLTQSGWNIDRVFGLCFERINNLYNAPNASGPTPDEEPDHEEFNRLLNLLRTLQKGRGIEIGTEGKQNCDEDKQNCLDIVVKLALHDDRFSNELDQVYELLQLDKKKEKFRLSTDFFKLKSTQNTEWIARTRSISGLLYYLSQNVTAPSRHREGKEQLVTVTRSNDEKPFDWSKTPAGSMFKVMTGKEQPGDAYIATRYRGHWFYIKDTDLESKTTFTLLRQLFDLQAGQRQSSGPTLTLPVR